MRAVSAGITLLCAFLSTVAPVFGIGDRYRYQTWHTENGLPQNSVHAILQTRDGYLWLATEGGLARFDGLKFVVFDSQNTQSLGSNNIRSLTEDNEGSLWIGTADGLTRFKDSNFTRFTAEQGLPSNNISSSFQDHTGRLWVLTAEGAAQYEKGRFFQRERTGISEGFEVSESGLPSKKITAFYKDSAGAVWVGTENGGARIKDGRVQRFAYPEALSSGFILSFFEDREGNLWIGTDGGGLTVLRDEKFRVYGSREGVSDDLVRCVFQDHRGVVWAGTNSHGLRWSDGQHFSSLTTKDGLSSNVVLSLAEDQEGNVLAGTPDGLNILRKGRVEILTSADGLPDDLIRSIFKDQDGSLWIGTRRGLSHWANGKFTNYTQAEGLPSDFIGTVLRGRSGQLWVGTLRGLAVLKGETFQACGLGKSAITSLYEDNNEALWIGTEEAGLIRLFQGQMFVYPPVANLPSSVLGILEDAHQQLWIPSPNGLYCVNKNDLNAYANARTRNISAVSYDTADGLPINQFSGDGHPTGWKDRSGTLWFATAKGMVSVDAKHTFPNRKAPPVVIEHVTADDRVLEPKEVNAFSPGLSRVAFEYAGLSFITPQKIRFKYKLQGFDKVWIDAGIRRAAYYTNLSPGKYHFLVLARNSDGVWNTNAASLSFRLQPHFYQTWWFAFLLLLAAGTLVYSFYRWRVRQVQAQFNAVLAERNRIAREIHDTLAQSFVAVSVQLEIINRLMSSSVESAAELLQQTRALVQDSLAEARRSIWDLRSGDGSGEDLAAKFSKAVKQATASTPLKVQLEVTGAYRRLPAKIEDEMLRIGQEAVTNVVRHAKATNLSVNLIFASNKVRMTISDDGQGFVVDSSLEGPEGHYGLRGMRERAEGIGGTLTVTSAVGKGTQIILELATQ
jgi:signal transduction histidine kinase/ligand-binding sensor domain-containing protein